jgi:formyl-CoA transferase
MSALSGITVVEIARFISGPFAGQLLADLGAEVIKVESPVGGDPFRAWGQDNLYSPHFCAYNRNKKSLAIDLSTPAGRGIVDRLVKQADVLIENFRPSTSARLGLQHEQLAKTNPRLVTCSISGLAPPVPQRHDQRTTRSARE